MPERKDVDAANELASEIERELVELLPEWDWSKWSCTYPEVLKGHFFHKTDGQRFSVLITATGATPTNCRLTRNFWPVPHVPHEEHHDMEWAGRMSAGNIVDRLRRILEFTQEDWLENCAARDQMVAPGRQLARDLAAALGEGWAGRLDSNDYERDYYVKLTKEEREISFFWGQIPDRPKDTYCINVMMLGDLPRHCHGRDWHEINVTARKTPKQIAGDIARRLLPGFEQNYLQAVRNRSATARAVEQGRGFADELREICGSAAKVTEPNSVDSSEFRVSIKLPDGQGDIDFRFYGGRSRSDTIRLDYTSFSPELMVKLLQFAFGKEEK